MKIPAPPELVTTQFADEVKITLISQSIKGISRIAQKLYFLRVQPAGVLPVILPLKLNDSKSVLVAFALSLQYYHEQIFE